MPRAARRARGFAPLAARSLMFMTMALRAACCMVIWGGMSVLATSMSVLRTARVVAVWMAETSSPRGTGMFDGVSRCFHMVWIIFRSPISFAVVKVTTLSWLYGLVGEIFKFVCAVGLWDFGGAWFAAD